MVFILSALWWIRIRGLWKLPDGKDWLRGILGLGPMGRAMFSKSLIQFSIDGWSCVPSLLFTWGQTMMEVMKIMVASLKRPQACTAIVCAPNPAAGRHWPTPAPETPGHSQASQGSLLWGQCSFLLGPGAQGSVCARQESMSQPCVSSGSSMVGLMVASSKRAYATFKSAAPRAPVPAAGHHWPRPLQETLRHSSVSVSVGPPDPGAHKVCLSRLSTSGGSGVWF